MRAILACLLFAFAALPTSSNAQYSKAELMSKAAEAARICAEYMPDSKAAKAAFEESGFRSEGIHDGLRIYSKEGRRLVAVTSVTSARRQMCGIAVSKLTPTEAEALIQPWLKESEAVQVEPWNSWLSKAWFGRFKNGPIALAIIEQIDLRIMRGAAITASSR